MEMNQFSRGAAPEDLYHKENELYERVWRRVTASQDQTNGIIEASANIEANANMDAMDTRTLVKMPLDATEAKAVNAGAKEEKAPKQDRKYPPETEGKAAGAKMETEAETKTKQEPSTAAAAQQQAEKTAGYMGKNASKEAVCFGPAAAAYESQLQEAIMEELSDCEYYKKMARKFCKWSSTFFSLAKEEFCHAKRFSAAYFLISGICMQPRKFGKTAPMPNLHAVLRSRFLAEQTGEKNYMRLAEETDDPCLQELFMQTAEAEREHAEIIRRLLECSIYS
ncbi:MAG: ferritin-like domain-containing protein [Oscillospiraceae bacterium]|nr:ferritin-like domain-containing protein [Oscillospiraceae bacterium]